MYIAIVNYNMGNLKSVENAFRSIGANVKVTSSPEVIRNASGVVLPGVGAFQDAIRNLKAISIYDTIIEIVNLNKPFLGICIGLQILFEYGTEGRRSSGLGIFKGSINKIPAGVKIPHMGWNSIKIIKHYSRIFNGIKDGESFYFVHSYYAKCDDYSIVNSITDYGIDLVSGVEKNNIYALQFHPEKSSRSGLKVLKNFVDIIYLNKNNSREFPVK